jgi:hypothetical protein
MGGFFETLWAVLRHGAALAVVYGLSVGLGLVMVIVAAFAVNALLIELGSGTDGDGLTPIILWSFPLWVPLGLGMAARYTSSDKLKPEGYPEHV